MMCACDESIGRRFLPHQIHQGCELSTQVRIAVTAGFQPSVCRECRGLPAEAHPTAESHGRTSKLKRYYWREIAFREFELLAKAAGSDAILEDYVGSGAIRKDIASRAIEDIKALHAANPKYSYVEEPDESVLRKNNVPVIDLQATYRKGRAGQRVRVIHPSHGDVSAEEFAALHFKEIGYSVTVLESRPFHALFGVFMWMLISDPLDPSAKMIGFGDRHAFERGEPTRQIWMPLPNDFGTSAFSERRALAIDQHFRRNFAEGDLNWLFDYWAPHSLELRQYLWAHRDEDVERARKLLQLLPVGVVLNILRYLIGSYWDRYLGWPDLLAHRESDGSYLFVEVKASGDKLSENQKDWIRGNAENMKLPFSLLKIHRQGTAP